MFIRKLWIFIYCWPSCVGFLIKLIWTIISSFFPSKKLSVTSLLKGHVVYFAGLCHHQLITTQEEAMEVVRGWDHSIASKLLDRSRLMVIRSRCLHTCSRRFTQRLLGPAHMQRPHMPSILLRPKFITCLVSEGTWKSGHSSPMGEKTHAIPVHSMCDLVFCVGSVWSRETKFVSEHWRIRLDCYTVVSWVAKIDPKRRVYKYSSFWFWSHTIACLACSVDVWTCCYGVIY